MTKSKPLPHDEKVHVIVEVVGGVVQNIDAGEFVDVQIVDWDEVGEGAKEWLAKLEPWVRERLDALYPDEMRKVRRLIASKLSQTRAIR